MEMARPLHVVSEVDLDLVSDDPAAQRAISVRLVCGDDLDHDHAAAAGGRMSLNLLEDVANYVVEDEEDFVERKKLFVVDRKNFCLRTRTPDGQKTILVKKKGQKDSSSKLVGATGISIQTPFFPSQIFINTSTGVVTLLPSKFSFSDLPREVLSKVGQPPAFRNVPGMNIALIACNGKAVCAEKCGEQPLNATRSVICGWETFSVVKPANGPDNAIRLRSGANGKYVCYTGEEALIANASQVCHAECFVEVDAGDGKIALKVLDNDKYVGGGPNLFLVPWLKEWEMFEVKVVEHVW